MANALARLNRHPEAATYFRIVNALRPGHPFSENTLSTSLALAGEYDESVRHFRNAVSLEPTNAWSRHNLVLALARNGRVAEAQAECRRELERNPENHLAYHALGKLFSDSNRYDDAISMLKKATELKPNDIGMRCNLGELLRTTGRNAEALAAFQEAIELRVASVLAHIARAVVLPNSAATRKPSQNTHGSSGNSIRPSGADAEPGGPPAPPYIDARVELIEPLIRLGRFKQADAAAQIALELPDLDRPRLQAMRRQREICRRLAPLEANLTTILAENDQPPDLAAHRALAEWCYQYGGLPAAAVRLFESVLLRQPSLAEDLQTQDRFHAACAAALAGSGHGADVAKLTDQERSSTAQEGIGMAEGRPERSAQANRPGQGRCSGESCRRRAWLARE